MAAILFFLARHGQKKRRKWAPSAKLLSLKTLGKLLLLLLCIPGEREKNRVYFQYMSRGHVGSYIRYTHTHTRIGGKNAPSMKEEASAPKRKECFCFCLNFFVLFFVFLKRNGLERCRMSSFKRGKRGSVRPSVCCVFFFPSPFHSPLFLAGRT